MFSQILLSSNLYNGWRQMYFIYPALLIITLIGIKFLFDFFKKKLSIKKYNVVATIITCILIINIAFIAQLMIRQHPYQYVYYNILAGRNLEEVKEKYPLDYWGLSFKDGLEYILRTDSREKITYYNGAGPTSYSQLLLDKQDSKRLVYVNDIDKADYYLDNYKNMDSEYYKPFNGFSLEKKVFSLIVDSGEILTVYKLK